jgi:hypothetical protein
MSNYPVDIVLYCKDPGKDDYNQLPKQLMDLVVPVAVGMLNTGEDAIMIHLDSMAFMVTTFFAVCSIEKTPGIDFDLCVQYKNNAFNLSFVVLNGEINFEKQPRVLFS